MSRDPKAMTVNMSGNESQSLKSNTEQFKANFEKLLLKKN